MPFQFISVQFKSVQFISFAL